MIYTCLRECVEDLEKNGQLVRIREEVDPYLEMAEIQRRVYREQGPALLFENVKGADFPALSNLFGTVERTEFIFRSTLPRIRLLMQLKANPGQALKKPHRFLSLPLALFHSLPKRQNRKHGLRKTTLSRLPLIHSWPDDGGPFITLPQVYSEDPINPSIFHSNMGMYRVQMGGNDYKPDYEVGLHYQIRRDIGIHHTNALAKDEPLKVSIFIGGPPAHTFSAVMPLPEGMSEAIFAGALGGRRFRFARENGFVLSLDADFCITGTVVPGQIKPEGPFGDHLGYYSLKHPFPYLRIESVYHREDAIWPFTVVGRPPQEDTSFGHLVHTITKPMVPASIPGVDSLHAVDEAGVHPLLLATGKERYVPYAEKRPMELLTHANAILGFGHCALAKYLIIAASDDEPKPDVSCVEDFFKHVFERIDLARDIHFQTRTTIDTLDYSGRGLNEGSKVVLAAAGEKKRELNTTLDDGILLPEGFTNPRLIFPGAVAVQSRPYRDPSEGKKDIQRLSDHFQEVGWSNGLPLIVVVDDSEFVAKGFDNFLWVTFTTSDPAADIHGLFAQIIDKHWQCETALIIDARHKPHHAPPLIEDPEVSRKVDGRWNSYFPESVSIR